jgi:uncharacterized membrane protein
MSEHGHKVDHADALGFERLVFFSDAVLAIAITLMALEIRIPEIELGSENVAEQVAAALQSLLPHIGVYMLSFAVVGIYWIVHHRLFRYIKRYDTRLMWFNLVFLMSGAFLPVATNALGTYPNTPLVIAFYSFSVALLGLTEFALWLYATTRGYTAVDQAPHASTYFGLRILSAPLVFLFSILLIPISLDLARISWALIIPLTIAIQRIFPTEHAERHAYEIGEV